MLVNQLIQGTAADVFKHSLIRLHAAGLRDFLILPVHDEVVNDVPTELVPDVVRVIEQEMPDRETFKVALTNDITVVDSWGAKYQ